MSRIYLGLALLIALALSSCDAFTTTKTIEREAFTFRHAGKKLRLPVELQEIRTSKSRGRLFSGRDVTYSYAIAVVYNGANLVQLPCTKDASLDDFIAQLRIRRSHDRAHFAIGKGRQTIAIFHSLNKIPFLGYAPLVNKKEHYDFKDTKLNKLPAPRAILKDHITGYKRLPAVSDDKLVDILCTLPPEDELNQEVIYLLAGRNGQTIGGLSEERLIAHCSRSDAWRRKAFAVLKENKDDQEAESYINKVYLLAGQDAVYEEDMKALKSYAENGNTGYFEARFEMTTPELDEEIRRQFRQKLEKSVFNVCSLSEKQQQNILPSVRLLERMGERDAFRLFVESYERSGCKSQTIHDINNSITFISDIRPYEKDMWVEFMVRNFRSVPPSARAWDYDRIKEDLSCSQKRDLLLQYRKDIDVYGNLEIPECK